MKIRRVVIKPYVNTIFPAISFDVEIGFKQYEEAIVGVDGFLTLYDDEKIIANLVEDIHENHSVIRAKNSKYDSDFKEAFCKLKLIAFLNKKSVAYMERKRMQNKKRDLFLALSLVVRTVVSQATISHLHEIGMNKFGQQPLIIKTASGIKVEGKMIAYAPDPSFNSDRGNRWIISGNGSPSFLSIETQIIYTRKKDLRINAIDWIHEYSPIFELGEFFIVEIPKGEEVLNRAWDYVKKAEECYRQWDTKGAYANCRDAGYFLNKTVGKKFRQESTIKKWKFAYDKFETLASVDLHEEDIIEKKPKGEISIGRPETEHILIVTKALIKYAEEFIQQNK